MPLGSAPVIPDGSQSLIAICPLAARTTPGASDWVEVPGAFDAISFQLVLTAQSAAVGNHLRVRVQQQLDGANPDDVVAFEELTDADTAKAQQTAFVPALRTDVDGSAHVLEDGALALGSVRAAPMGRRFRVKWTQSASTSYTFQVVARLHSRGRR